MASHGIKVSSPGNDALTQAVKDLQFHTEYNTLKLLQAGTIEVTTNGSGDATASVTHGLGFAPAFFTFQKCTAAWSFLDTNSYPNAYVPDVGEANIWGGNYHSALHAYTDNDKIYVQAKGAAASTIYYVKYYLLVDLAESYTGNANVAMSKNFGLKVSQPGYDVLTAKEYQLGYSQRYKSLLYYNVSYKVHSLTLPALWASPIDAQPEEGTYVDINHGLGYPPFFWAFYRSDTYQPTISYAVPYRGLNSANNFVYSVASFCDATRVRLSFWRKSYWSAPNPDPKWNQETVVVKCYVFTEDLSQSSL